MAFWNLIECASSHWSFSPFQECSVQMHTKTDSRHTKKTYFDIFAWNSYHQFIVFCRYDILEYSTSTDIVCWMICISWVINLYLFCSRCRSVPDHHGVCILEEWQTDWQCGVWFIFPQKSLQGWIHNICRIRRMHKILEKFCLLRARWVKFLFPFELTIFMVLAWRDPCVTLA